MRNFLNPAAILGGSKPNSERCGYNGAASHAAFFRWDCRRPEPQIRGLYQQRATV